MDQELQKVFNPFYTSSGGIMFAMCPHGVVYGAQPMLRCVAPAYAVCKCLTVAP